MSDQMRQTAAGLARAIDAALSRRDLVEARVLADAGLRLPRRTPALAEALARFHLAHGRPESALRMLSDLPRPGASTRHLRAVALLALDRTIEARMELLHAAGPEAPAESRLLAALLAWEAGDHDEAASLARSVERGPWAPLAEVILTALHVSAGDLEAAEAPAARLHALAALPGLRQVIRLFLASLGLRRTHEVPDADLVQVSELSDELAAAPALLARLVDESRWTQDRSAARLLRCVLIARIAAEPERSDLIVALADLTDLLDGPVIASEVTRRGLADHPLSATLRLLDEQFRRRVENVETDAPDGATIEAGAATHLRKIAA